MANGAEDARAIESSAAISSTLDPEPT